MSVPREALSPQVLKHVDPQSPPPLRMMAAKGLVPMPPRDTVSALSILAHDADPELAKIARGTLGTLPPGVLATALADDGLHSGILDLVANYILEVGEAAEALLLNRTTPDHTIERIAPYVDQARTELIAANQQRLMRSPNIVLALKKNPNLMRSTLDRAIDFLVRSGIILDGVPEFADSLARLSPHEQRAMADKIELPPEAAAFMGLAEEEEDEETAGVAVVCDLDAPDEEERRKPVAVLVRAMSTGQKVAFAVKGNKEARTILIKDANKVVATAAIKSPAITEGEIVAAAKSRSICDDVIRVIAGSKEMTRAYQVKVALVNNPKTPIPLAMRFLPLLRSSDLAGVARSRNVAGAVAKQAKLLRRRKSGG